MSEEGHPYDYCDCHNEKEPKMPENKYLEMAKKIASGMEKKTYSQLSDEIATALESVAREKDAEIARLKMLVDFPESSFKWRWAKAQEEIAEEVVRKEDSFPHHHPHRVKVVADALTAERRRAEIAEAKIEAYKGRLQEAEKDVKSWKDSFSDSVRHIKDLEDKKMELEKEVDRLTHLHNLDHSLADQWQKKNEELEARLEEREKEFQEVKLHNELHEDLENVVIVELESELERHKAVVGAAKYLIHPSKNESPSEVCPECKTYGVGELREALTALEEFRKGKS